MSKTYFFGTFASSDDASTVVLNLQIIAHLLKINADTSVDELRSKLAALSSMFDFAQDESVCFAIIRAHAAGRDEARAWIDSALNSEEDEMVTFDAMFTSSELLKEFPAERLQLSFRRLADPELTKELDDADGVGMHLNFVGPIMRMLRKK